MPRARESRPLSEADLVVDALLRASRALVGVAARSIASVDDDVTLPQYRALVVLASRGSANSGALADALGVHPSTATRMCDRLVAKGLISRSVSPESRREVTIDLTRRGRRLVDAVTARRRQEIAAVVDRVPEAQRVQIIDALGAFGDAAGEPPDASWPLGWAIE